MQTTARECRALHTCRQVATASKHWHITNHPDPDVAVIVTATPYPPPTNAATTPVPVYALPHWHIYFIDGAERTTAAEIFDQALEFWTHYIYQNGIAK